MKTFLTLWLLLIPYVGLTAQPNVPLYVRWDGTIAAPTQFLAAVFKAGANITFTDNATNITIAATTSGSAATNFVVQTATDLTNLVYTVGANGTNFTVTTATTLSNLIYSLGANGTNYANSIFSSLSNRDDTMLQAATNYSLSQFTALSNRDDTILQSSTNYANTVASNRVVVIPDWATAVVTNNSGSTMTFTVAFTNRVVTVATNATSATLDFSGVYQHYEVPVLMTTNLVLSPTNLVQGRELWVFFDGSNGNYDVTVTNTSGTAVRWNLNSATNGSTSFTVTNGQRAELCITCRSNNVLHAVYGQYR